MTRTRKIPPILTRDEWNQIIDDYLSQTDTSDQNVASKLVFASGKGPDTLGTKKIDESGIGNNKALVYKSASGKIEYDTVDPGEALGAHASTHASGGSDPLPDPFAINDVNFSTGKRPKFDFAYFNPSSAPAETQGHTYYDSALKKLRLRTDSEWLVIPAVGGGGSTYKLTPNYTIYIDGSTYYAMDEDGNVSYSNAELYNVTRQVIAALNGVGHGSIEFKDGTFMMGKQTMREACDSGWISADANVTVSHDTGDKQEGTGSVKLVVDAAFTTGLAAYKNISSVDLSIEQLVSCYFKPSILLANGDVQIILSESANCATEDFIANLYHGETLAAATWKRCSCPSSLSYPNKPENMSSLNAVVSIGIKIAVDKGGCTLWMDEISTQRGFINIESQNINVFGQGVGVTILKLNDTVDISGLYMSVNKNFVGRLEYDGNGGNQRIIDGCDGIYFRGVTSGCVDDVYVHDTKGSALRFRDCSRLGIKGETYNSENPGLTLSNCTHCNCDVNIDTTTDDDCIWLLTGSKNNFIRATLKGGVSSGLRFDGQSGYVTEENIAIITTESNVQAGVAFTNYTRHNTVYLTSKDDAKGAYFYNNSGPGNKVFGSVYNSSSHGVHCEGTGNEIYVAIESPGTLSSDYGAYIVGDENKGDIRVVDSVNHGIRIDGDLNNFRIFAKGAQVNHGCVVNGNDNIVTGHALNNAVDGVRVAGTHNKINVRATDNQGTKTQDYGCQETSGGDYNIFINCDVTGNINETIPIVGAHTRIINCIPYTPVGNITNPFNNTSHTFGLPAGGAAGPTVASQDYICVGVDCTLNISGGTGADVTLQDKNSAVISDFGDPSSSEIKGLNVKIGQIVNFGGFSAAPTVVVSGN